MPAPPTSSVRARLYTTPGGWGMPSLDADALSAHALLRFARIPYASIASHASPGEPPQTVVEQCDGPAAPETVHGLSGLIALLASDSSLPDPNPNLTPCMTAESTAFSTLVAARLAPARTYEFFLKPVNYDDVHHTVLSHGGAFPLNRVLPYLARRHYRARFAAAGKSVVETYFDAGITLAALGTRLGVSRYFYGDTPSVLDAVVFGQLVSILYAPLPEPELRAMLVAHGNLVQYVQRIKNEFFPETAGLGWGADLDAEEVAEVRRAAAARRAAQQRREDASERARRERDRVEKERAGDGSGAPESEEDRRQRYNWYFIYGSVAAFAAHLLFGNEIELEVG